MYKTLFSNSEQYIKIAEVLSKKRSGLTREEIVKETGLQSNGVLSGMLANLEKSGFIRINDMYGMKKREKTYQLSDYYSMFYFRFIRDNYGKDEHFWSNTTDNPARNVWAGLTYEQVCKDHMEQIKKKLGILGVYSEVSSWSSQGNADEKGAQIDLLIDRRDRVINICEIKHSVQQYEIKKEDDENLRNKIAVFRNKTKTTKTLLLTMVTTFGVKKNKYSNYFGKEVTLDDLFEKV